MLNYKNLAERRIVPMNIASDPTLSKMQAIALELDEIKKVLSRLEQKENHSVKIDDLDEIEKRLDALEVELFYDSLN
ncbi:hypothetical protein JXJ21_23015 [candidate division KSB1 bacterium]|nr:hypothetical protein [candidate division KSB1 bacterium]